MVKKYDPVIDFTAFSKLRDELGKDFNHTKDPASSRRLEEVSEEIGDALTRGFGELFGRVTQTASQGSASHRHNQSASTDGQTSTNPDLDHCQGETTAYDSAHPWQPVMDSYESSDAYTLVFELAGVDPAAVEMDLAGNTLTLSGKVAAVHETQTSGSGSESEFGHNSNFSAHERRTGDFKRSVELPTDAMTDDLTASAGHGLLTVSIPKQQSLKPRKITITVAD